MIRKAESKSGDAPLYQIKITLKWSRPAIWRRVVVRGDMKLERFHILMQYLMPWTNSHMHQFIVGYHAPVYYGVRHPEFGDMGPEMLDEKRYTVADLAPAAKKKFIYEYDFGDGWQHEVVLEKILAPDANFKHPICMAGANACPPDDCGGIPGYYRMLKILADPKHPEHEDVKEWIGGEWDPASFDLDSINEGLKQFKA